MGSFPHELSGYRHLSGDATRATFEALWGVALDNEPGLRIPNMLDAAVDGSFKGLYVQGEDICNRTRHQARRGRARRVECVVVQDLFLNETAIYAHVFLPGSTFLERTHLHHAERRIQRVRKVMACSQIGDPLAIARPMAFPCIRSSLRNHGRDRAAHADLCRRLFEKLDALGSDPVARATRRRRRARRSCIWAASCAARASSSSPNMSPPTAHRPALPAPAHDRPHPQQ